MSLPTYFLSHGAPDIVLRDAAATRFLRELKLPKAKAISVVSAHWMTTEPMDAVWNHPTNDHLLPLFTVLGATAGSGKA